MNHRKFQQRPDELLTELTYAQAQKVIAVLNAERIVYELIIASKGEHVHEKALHIQNVNA